jgi:mannitol-1-/sugar-/sorbitol-6-phosphatase
MSEITCSAMLFDMDGVLIDSTPAVERVWTKWAVKHGFEPAEVVRAAHGRPSITTIREYLPNADHSAENDEVERCEIEDLEGVVALPGAMELLTSLPKNRWAIVTSCTRPLAEVRLKSAGLPRPMKLVTSSDVKHGKPAPEPYLKGAEFLGVDARDCIVVEDAPAGIRAGKSAGARVIALSTIADVAELREAGADWLVKDCASIRLVQPVNGDGAIKLEVKA